MVRSSTARIILQVRLARIIWAAFVIAPTMETMTDLLDKYKRQPFAAGLVPFASALRALGTPFARIYVEEAGRQRWVVRGTQLSSGMVLIQACSDL